MTTYHKPSSIKRKKVVYLNIKPCRVCKAFNVQGRKRKLAAKAACAPHDE